MKCLHLRLEPSLDGPSVMIDLSPPSEKSVAKRVDEWRVVVANFEPTVSLG
jgi:hypothetical protein